MKGVVALCFMLFVSSCSYTLDEYAILQKGEYRYKKSLVADSTHPNAVDGSVKKNMLDSAVTEIETQNGLTVRRNFVRTNDSTVLEYFSFLPNVPKRTIYYFMGNLENMQTNYAFLQEMALATQSEVLTVHYRGYGKSKGRHSLFAQVADNQRFYELVPAKSSEKMAVGYSLGSHYASRLAYDNGFKKLVLLSPFSAPEDILSHYKRVNMKGMKALMRPFVKLNAQPALLSISNTELIEKYPGKLTFFMPPTTKHCLHLWGRNYMMYIPEPARNGWV